jgi:hypothetical protein
LKSYFLKLSAHEEGSYSEEQVAQLFADGRVDRNTPCRLASGADWKTIDDFMPMLKYGTQLPNPTTAPIVRSEDSPVYGSVSVPPPVPQGKVLADARVTVVDFDLPFSSILKLMFKWMAAGFLVFCCFLPAIAVLFFILMAIFGTLLGGLISGFHHP